VLWRRWSGGGFPHDTGTTPPLIQCAQALLSHRKEGAPCWQMPAARRWRNNLCPASDRARSDYRGRVLPLSTYNAYDKNVAKILPQKSWRNKHYNRILRMLQAGENVSMEVNIARRNGRTLI